ncbi:MAG TPA: isochorismate synthase [Actinomycetota bacterium]|jgi:isochorismate synthase|nr:isochorismate synthase [Actinomycetota bacterium]
MSEPLASSALRLGPAFDLLSAYHDGGSFFERSGLGLAATGEAARVDAGSGPERIVRLSRMLAEAFAQIRRHPESPPPVAVASIGFDDDRPAEAVIPERAAIRLEAGETWQVEVSTGVPGDSRGGHARWAGRTLPHDAFEEIQLRPDPEPDEYAEAVARAVAKIGRGELRKVVLARSMLVDAGRALDPKQLLWRLRAVDPDCYVFAAPQRGGAGNAVLVGATPELLVRRRGRAVEATPLAGSAQRFGDPERDRSSADRLFASAKDREEHAVVVEEVARTLRAFCDGLEHPREPELLGTANVWHLATPFRGRLHDPDVTALDLVAALHPTPAVCGMPREVAREVLDQLEPIERGTYAGPIGWVDASGDGEWAIALRCAEITGSTARLFAGAGIVADSVPEAEVDETERKFRALLDALRWG